MGLKCQVKRKLSERNQWLLHEDADYFLSGVQEKTGKNYKEQIKRLDQEDIKKVEDLYNLSDADYKELGFSIGLKCKVQYYLAQRTAMKQ